MRTANNFYNPGSLSRARRRFIPIFENYWLFLRSHTYIFFILFFIPTTISCSSSGSNSAPFFNTRGIVLSPEDLNTIDWVKMAKDANLTTLGVHTSPAGAVKFVQSPSGQRFLDECKQLGIQVEYEMHAMDDLLPRNLFEEDSTMFRMNKEGKRVNDYNLCVSSAHALQVVCANAVKYAKILRPTTGKYYYWIDDGRPMCHCPECSKYSESEQVLILDNAILKALQQIDPNAKLAYLAYYNTMNRPPVRVRPEKGIFLEFAPIRRSRYKPINEREVEIDQVGVSSARTHGDILDLLDKNLNIFGRENAQILEYWLDVSLFSKWEKPAVKLPWNEQLFLSDIDTYAKKGIRNIKTFGVYIDSAYVHRYKDISFIKDYGEGLYHYEQE